MLRSKEECSKLIGLLEDKILQIVLYELVDTVDELEQKVEILEEKATPEKPLKEHFEVQGYPRFSYKCPNCHKFIGLDVSVKQTRYCEDCGQALDWSVKEDD